MATTDIPDRCRPASGRRGAAADARTCVEVARLSSPGTRIANEPNAHRDTALTMRTAPETRIRKLTLAALPTIIGSAACGSSSQGPSSRLPLRRPWRRYVGLAGIGCSGTAGMFTRTGSQLPVVVPLPSWHTQRVRRGHTPSQLGQRWVSVADPVILGRHHGVVGPGRSCASSGPTTLDAEQGCDERSVGVGRIDPVRRRATGGTMSGGFKCARPECGTRGDAHGPCPTCGAPLVRVDGPATDGVVVGSRRRSLAWIFYAVFAGLVAVGSLLKPDASTVLRLAAAVGIAMYARYLYRGGRVVIWFFP
jgi:hypothetical protein